MIFERPGKISLAVDEEQHPIPDSFRRQIREIVEAFVQGDFKLELNRIDGVMAVPPRDADAMARNVVAYGDTLAPLNEAVWERSCYIWTDRHWDMIIDLSTSRETVSDLVLMIKVHSPSLTVEILSIHVP